MTEYIDSGRGDERDAPAAASPSIAVIGGGPAGLMAAEVLSNAGVQVNLFDGMPSVGRKFLLAGKGGMNLTHSEPLTDFLPRYGERRAMIEPFIRDFDAAALRAWCDGLGIPTFAGTSGRVFPKEMKAAPLLRAWLHRLRAQGVQFHMRHRWLGWQDDLLRFAAPGGERSIAADATILALGGASWARLGSDGAWVPLLEQRRVAIAPLQPSNCGFDIGWSEHFRTRFAGQPLKSVTAGVTDLRGNVHRRQGELMITATGIEGGLVYALSSVLRDRIHADGHAELLLDLAPGKDVQRLTDEIAHPRGSRSMGSHLQSRAGIHGAKAGLLRETATKEAFSNPPQLAALVKRLPLKLIAPRPLDEAISSAGGIRFDALDDKLMLHTLPGVFCAGEMLDWEAPTGGYLLTACFATGRAAARGALAWLDTRR